MLKVEVLIDHAYHFDRQEGAGRVEGRDGEDVGDDFGVARKLPKVAKSTSRGSSTQPGTKISRSSSKSCLFEMHFLN